MLLKKLFTVLLLITSLNSLPQRSGECSDSYIKYCWDQDLINVINTCETDWKEKCWNRENV